MLKAIINLNSLTCPSCLPRIDGAVKGLDGVEKESVVILLNSSKLRVDFDSASLTIKDIEKTIEELGYPVIDSIVRTA